MKVYQKVRSSANAIPTIHVNKDTVYVRTDIETVTEEDFKGFEYTETQYSMKEYMENLTLTEDLDSVSTVVTMLMSKVVSLESRLKVLEGPVV